MSVDCGACCAKYLLCLFNFVFFIAGSVVLSIGIWIAADKSSFIEATKIIESTDLSQFTQPNVIHQVAYMLIASGAFIFIISFLGYCGAIKESRCLLSCYGIALIIILVVELTAGGLVLGYRDKAEEKVREVFKSTITKYYTTTEKGDGVTLFWNQMMVQLKCCGVDNFHDFESSKFRTEGNKTVPESCCVLVGDKNDVNKLTPKDPRCPYRPSEANSYYMTGCYKTFINLLLDHANIAIAVGIGLGLVQLLGIFLAFCLCKSIDRYFK
ncbi:tetraspanin-18, putative [Pediculus humanus corporis]|uniref:Tetraspanin n=1 Tax=Pediculus humanus subsp. corporis TaxID=121224 RepID=E0VNB3_PEDHC|nr:tetraspanin-18, putative [Pediculus humanus corporis]EEB14869.1 tetraspanin-18, putative [Pediculus humanus corporis]